MGGGGSPESREVVRARLWGSVLFILIYFFAFFLHPFCPAILMHASMRA